MTERAKNTYAIQTVDNALCVLEAISEETGDFTLSHLSAKLGMERSYIFRMLATFEQRGYVQQVEPSGRYRAGLSAYETGSKFLHQMVLLQKAKPIMETLAKDSGEAVYLAMPGEKDLLFLDMVDSPQQVRVVPLVGRRFSLHQFSAGKVILAFRSEPATLPYNMKMILRQEAAVDQGALEEGVDSMSVPVFDSNAEVAGSLCVVVPSFRLNQETIDKELIPRLKVAGQSISAKLGFISDPIVKSTIVK